MSPARAQASPAPRLISRSLPHKGDAPARPEVRELRPVLAHLSVTLTAGVTADKEASMTTTAKSPAAAQLEANKAVIRAFVDAWNSRDFGRFQALMGRDAVLRIGGGVVPCDPAGTRAIAEEWTTAFPDWRFDLRALIAEGDRSGTHRQPILGVAPTNRYCSVDEIVIFRVN